MATRLDVAIMQGMLIVTVGVMFYYIFLALGAKQMAGLMRVAVIMAVIGVVVPAVWAFLLGIKEGIAGFVETVDGWVEAITFWR